MTREHYDTNLINIQQKWGKNTEDENRLIGVALTWGFSPHGVPVERRIVARTLNETDSLRLPFFAK